MQQEVDNRRPADRIIHRRVALWRELAHTSPQGLFEDQFARAAGQRRGLGDASLYDDMRELAGLDRADEAIELIRLVLERGAKRPDRWWRWLGRLLLEQGKTAAAEEPVRQTLARLNSDTPAQLHLCMDYHRSCDEPGLEAAAFFGGQLHVAGFTQAMDAERIEAFGAAPANAADRFAEFLVHWLQPLVDSARLTHTGNWALWIDAIGSPVLAQWQRVLAAEHQRRRMAFDRLYGALEMDASGKGLDERIAEVLTFPSHAALYSRAARRLGRHPEAAYRLYRHALGAGNIGGDNTSSSPFLACADNLLRLCMVPELAPHTAEAMAMALPWAYQHPPIFVSAARLCARQQDHDQALRHLKLAVRHGLEELVEVYSDPDFAELRGMAAFEALFAQAIREQLDLDSPLYSKLHL